MCLFTDWEHTEIIYLCWECQTAKYIINTINHEVPPQQLELQRLLPARQRPGVARQQQMAGQQGDGERQPQDEQPCCCSLFCACILWLMIAISRLIFITAGTSVQLMTCFRRDSVNTYLIPIDGNSSMKLLKCDDKREIICGLLIPDSIIILVAFWVYFGLKFGHRCTCALCEWEELQTAMKADTAERLNALVADVKAKLQKKSIIAWYTVTPLMYIVLSQATSGMYLAAFHLTNKHVIIQPPLGEARLAGDEKMVSLCYHLLVLFLLIFCIFV